MADLTRRSLLRAFVVMAGGVVVGRLDMPASAAECADDAETFAPRNRKLLIMPERWGPNDENVVYMQVMDDGECRARMWWAESPEEQEAIERFWQACLQVDWDAIAIHEVEG